MDHNVGFGIASSRVIDWFELADMDAGVELKVSTSPVADFNTAFIEAFLAVG